MRIEHGMCAMLEEKVVTNKTGFKTINSFFVFVDDELRARKLITLAKVNGFWKWPHSTQTIEMCV